MGEVHSDVYKWYESCNAYIGDYLEDFLVKFYGSKSKVQPISSSGFRLNPCPKCGHKDCSTFGSKAGIANCFSCGWAGNYISTYTEYVVEVLHKSKDSAIRDIENFTSISYPRKPLTEEQKRAYEKHERIKEIKARASKFYSEQMMIHTKQYDYEGRKMTPLDYIKAIRSHTEDTVKAFSIGFSSDYFVLRQTLLDEGFSEEEIQDSLIWIPDGVIIYPQKDPISGEILRFNTKNPFKAKMDVKGKDEPIVIVGFSRGEKVMGFAPGFSFNKPIIIVEGENDAESLYETNDDKAKNVSWMSGNPSQEQFSVFKYAKKPIYIMTDNDDVGKKYVDLINDSLPDKQVYKINYDKTVNDPDDYYKKTPNPKTVSQLIDEAEPLKTEKFVIDKKDTTWTIENRHKKLMFEMESMDNKTGAVIGCAKIYIDEQLKDSKSNTALSKLTAVFKPFNFFLEEKIEEYYNTPDGGLEEKSNKDLVEMYFYSKYKSEIIKAFAKKVLESEADMEAQIVKLREKLGQNAVDEILKEINDIQNKGLLDSLITIPTLKLSHFFSVKNNDAYFYFTAVKYDGDTIRKIPYLLRNDGHAIRLDLLKRKDTQCLLLIDNKYELPDEVNEAKLKLSECSLVAEWANKYASGAVTVNELSPYGIVKEIEGYLKRFYYHKDSNIYKIVAIYIYGTYFYELFGQYPYLFLNGEKGSGKTILDTAIYMLALNAKLAVNISEASLFRLVSIEGGTMILDEIENLTSRTKSQDSLMATVLKGGYQKGGKAYRQNMDLNQTEGFDVFSPKVISNIYGVEDVIEDRCIRIDSHRMKIKKGIKMEDPKVYLSERMDEIRMLTSRAALSALKHFQVLYKIYEASHMITDNARLTQLLTPILAISKFVDIAKENLSLANVDAATIENIHGEYTKAFFEFYESNIRLVKEDIEKTTPEGVIKFIVNSIANELEGLIEDKDREYTNVINHKYCNPIKYTPETGEFVLDALHIKTFMEEHLDSWKISTTQVHTWMKSIYGTKDSKRRVVSLENSSQELIDELRGAMRPKIYHYFFNVKEIIEQKNVFISGTTENTEISSEVKNPF